MKIYSISNYNYQKHNFEQKPVDDVSNTLNFRGKLRLKLNNKTNTHTLTEAIAITATSTAASIIGGVIASIPGLALGALFGANICDSFIKDIKKYSE